MNGDLFREVGRVEDADGIILIVSVWEGRGDVVLSGEHGPGWRLGPVQQGEFSRLLAQALRMDLSAWIRQVVERAAAREEAARAGMCPACGTRTAAGEVEPAPGDGPDAQYRHLLDAARSASAAARLVAGDARLAGREDTPAGELAAKADHLAACVYAVDSMCRGGDLPGEWRAAGDEAAREAR